jgi:peptidoglycan-associated lipoprotein
MLVLMAAAVAAVWLVAGCTCKVPQQEMDAARAAIADAKAAEAPQYAPGEYKSAEDMMAKSEKESSDNLCDDAKASAIEAVRLAKVAEELAKANKAALAPKPVVRQAEPIPQPPALVFSTVYFDFDNSDVRDDQKAALDGNAKALTGNPAAAVTLEGYCDERGTDEYNIALGQRRADSAKSYLVTMGVAADRMATISYGEEKPADPGTGEEAWAKNRRVQFVTK